MNADKTKNSSCDLSYPRSSAFISGRLCFWAKSPCGNLPTAVSVEQGRIGGIRPSRGWILGEI
jgi:hypothetical protein